MEKIESIEMRDTLDKSGYELRDFWEFLDDGKKSEQTVDVESIIIDSIKKSKSVIYINSRTILDSKIIESLRRAHSRGVRIYLLLEEIEDYKWLDFGISHIFKDKMFSSYILIDPFDKKPYGIWMNKSIFQFADLVLRLDTKVIRELAGHFSREFWDSKPEIFFGKELSNVKYPKNIPDIPTVLSSTSVEINHPTLSENEINTISLPIEVIQLGEDFWSARDFIFDSKNVIIPLDDLSKEFVEEIKDYNPTIYGGNPSFGFIKIKGGNEKAYVFMPDILLEIPRDEENNLENISNKNRLWKFVKSKKLSEIKKKLILWDAKWSDDQSFRIKDRDELILEDFECESIDEWLNYKNTPRPELPSENEIPLALNVELRWRILPPYLPIEAKKHKLYSKWDDFKKRILKTRDDMLRFVEKELENKKNLRENDKLKKSDYGVFESEIIRIKKIILDALKVEEWYGIKVESERLLEVMARAENELNELYMKYTPKKINEKTELDELKKRKDSQQTKWNINIPSKDDIPRSLPSIGELYTHNNRNFLVIEHRGEIDKAKRIAEEYNAKIVVKR
ncbi:MAG: hypothetical protein J7L08_04095 [Candidatus Aenigmarchaeota archaeon]|nr:hypothetical protein [Candidatus Aenigmarchaeota archaeon]